MADVFLEHMVARRTTPTLFMAKIGLYMAVIVICLAILVFIPEFGGIVSAVLILGFWGAFTLAKRMNLEYEYIVTNGEMDIDKIMGRNARKRMLTVDCRQFEILAPMKPAYQAEYQSRTITKRIDVSSSPQSEDRWFAVFPGKEGRTLLVFEPNDRMLEVFRTYIPRKIQQ